MPADFIIERMTLKDLPQVMEIEKVSFPTPFTENLFRMELNLDVAHLYVARGQGEFFGYMDFWRVEREIHVITIAVHPGHRKEGIGTALIRFMMEEARKYAVELVSLDVRPSNEPALRLYRKFGFEASGVRKRYYQDNNEDALIMSRKC